MMLDAIGTKAPVPRADCDYTVFTILDVRVRLVCSQMWAGGFHDIDLIRKIVVLR